MRLFCDSIFVLTRITYPRSSHLNLECGDLSPLSVRSKVTVEKQDQDKNWPHAPLHQLNAGGFIVTASTHRKSHIFQGSYRLDLLQTTLLALAKRYEWNLEAWSIFPNHYHFVGRRAFTPATTTTTTTTSNLRSFLSHYHAETAREVNRMDEKAGRKVWFNFWETRLTYQQSYFARLKYVHQNAVKHGLVSVANQYPWCSASWFERVAMPSMVKTIYGYKTDAISIEDDY